MRKAINFDIDTKKYEKLTSKKSSNAYLEIYNYFNNNSFEHRQGSDYVSKEDLTNNDITTLIIKMSKTLDWLKYCVKKIDVTNIGKQHSLITTLKNTFDIIDLLFDKEIDLKIKENIYQFTYY